MINKIFEQLKSQHSFPDELFKKYQFEVRNNKIYIMTDEAYQFTKIRARRKGLLFANIKGNKIELTNTFKDLTVILSVK